MHLVCAAPRRLGGAAEVRRPAKAGYFRLIIYMKSAEIHQISQYVKMFDEVTKGGRPGPLAVGKTARSAGRRQSSQAP